MVIIAIVAMLVLAAIVPLLFEILKGIFDFFAENGSTILIIAAIIFVGWAILMFLKFTVK